ncbi:MAG: hypothetical protein ACRELB_00845 [Polyangiaceae bacterium]
MRRPMTRIELATPLCVGTILGLSAGILLGAAAGVLGVFVGLALGAAAGVFAGTAMHHDAGRRAARSRELDEIIGVAGGDLGAGPITMPTPQDAAATPSAWMAEWLTPPPPVAG